MVQAGVFRKVAMDGIQPCSSSGVSTMPVQNMACVWLAYSLRQHPPAQQQAEQVDGIEPRKPRLPEAHPVQLSGPRPARSSYSPAQTPRAG